MQYSLGRLFTTVLFSFSALANAGVITTGQLSYDTSSQIISASNGQTYLGWGVAADLNYAETVAATSVGGVYESYHIASQSEAIEFFSLATGESDAYVDVSISDNNAARFGNNDFGGGIWGTPTALFVLDPPGYSVPGGIAVGSIVSSADSLFYALDEFDLSFSDEFSASGAYPNNPVSWLLVSDDSQLVAVNEPSTVLILCAGLLGLVRLRRGA